MTHPIEYQLTLTDGEGILMNVWSIKNVRDHVMFEAAAKESHSDLAAALIAAMRYFQSPEDTP